MQGDDRFAIVTVTVRVTAPTTVPDAEAQPVSDELRKRIVNMANRLIQVTDDFGFDVQVEVDA
jgi:hypothetical protein